MSEFSENFDVNASASEVTNNITTTAAPTTGPTTTATSLLDEEFSPLEYKRSDSNSQEADLHKAEILVDTSNSNGNILDQDPVSSLTNTGGFGMDDFLATESPITDLAAGDHVNQFSAEKSGNDDGDFFHDDKQQGFDQEHNDNLLEMEKAPTLMSSSTSNNDDDYNKINNVVGIDSQQQSYSNSDDNNAVDSKISSDEAGEVAPQYSPATEDSSREVEEIVKTEEQEDSRSSGNNVPSGNLLSLEDDDEDDTNVSFQMLKPSDDADTKKEELSSSTLTEPVVSTPPKTDPDSFAGISSSAADTTTPGAGDGPVKMPKATTISPPTKLPRGTSSSGSVSAWLKHIDPRVWDLLLWRDPRFTGVVLAGLLVALISLARYSIFSVVSNVLLITLVITLITRIVKIVVAKVHKGDNLHPLKDILDAEMLLSEEVAVDCAQALVQRLNPIIAAVRDWTLVKEFIPSLKFSLVLYALTYIGACFNGLTVIILATVAAFTLPKVYEVNKAQIDQYVNVAQSKFDDYYQMLQDKVPYLKKQKTQ